MKKRSSYRPRPLTAPMLVSRGLIDSELEMRERMIVQAFSGGWATSEHFDNLVDMRNVTVLAAAYKEDKSALAICDGMRVVMANIRARHAQTGKFGVTGDENKLLLAFIDTYRDFWLRQPVKLYETACDELSRAMQVAKEPQATDRISA